MQLTHLIQHRWFSGRMLACHAGGPGSIPGRCSYFLPATLHLFSSASSAQHGRGPGETVQRGCEGSNKKDKEEKKFWRRGVSIPVPLTAKRALYHLSYVPFSY